MHIVTGTIPFTIAVFLLDSFESAFSSRERHHEFKFLQTYAPGVRTFVLRDRHRWIRRLRIDLDVGTNTQSYYYNVNGAADIRRIIYENVPHLMALQEQAHPPQAEPNVNPLHRWQQDPPRERLDRMKK
ncbi:uncharacterized protein LOC117181065 [Belonocnema kinseyi]|uniref:uncharacterized protein LOC117181065 n=1 Tax=Belonocnema kinseyi TaxID=2817044 RepID=UPI00143CC3A0|nr:uncharacterized protein LOC117181065 [Belonocnema kinseyi]